MDNQPYPPDPRVPAPGYQQQPDYPGYSPSADTVQSANLGGGAYSQSQRESYVDPAGNRVESRETTFEDKNQSRANTRYWITRVTYFVLAVLEVIMLLRLIFRLLGANQDNAFISFLYGLSHLFVAPFNGIFNDQTIGHSVFELSTLIAMLVYALIAWGIVSLGRVLFAPIISGRQTVSTTRRSRF